MGASLDSEGMGARRRGWGPAMPMRQKATPGNSGLVGGLVGRRGGGGLVVMSREQSKARVVLTRVLVVVFADGG